MRRPEATSRFQQSWPLSQYKIKNQLVELASAIMDPLRGFRRMHMQPRGDVAATPIIQPKATSHFK
jgi:hypothetical protein